MAIEKNHSLTGKLGPTVSYILNGQIVVRIIGNYIDPKTTKQLKNREKMRLTSRFIRAMHSTIKIGYQETSIDYPSNEARQFLLKNCFSEVNESIVLEYGNIKIARGEIVPPEETSLTKIDDPSGNSTQQLALITWKKPIKQNSTDMVILAMFSDTGEQGVAWPHRNIAHRKDGTVSLPLPKSDQPVHFWMFFYNDEAANGESRKKISDSVYLGAL